FFTNAFCPALRTRAPVTLRSVSLVNSKCRHELPSRAQAAIYPLPEPATKARFETSAKPGSRRYGLGRDGMNTSFGWVRTVLASRWWQREGGGVGGRGREERCRELLKVMVLWARIGGFNFRSKAQKS